jgi:amino acid transporter
VAAVVSTFALLFIFVFVALAIQSLLPNHVIGQNSADILAYVANKLAPRPWNYVVLLAVISSTVGTLETTLLPASRVALSMARDKVFPSYFRSIYQPWKTPLVGSLILAALSFIGIFLLAFSPSVSTFLDDIVTDSGILVAFYYGSTALTAAYYMRRQARNAQTMLIGVIFPFLAALFLIAVGIYAAVTGGLPALIPVVITFVVGALLMAYYRFKNPPYFSLLAEPHASVAGDRQS